MLLMTSVFCGTVGRGVGVGVFLSDTEVEVWLGFVQKSIIVHKYSNRWLMKPFKKCHKSGFIVSFMHFSSELLLLLSQPHVAELGHCGGFLVLASFLPLDAN